MEIKTSFQTLIEFLEFEEDKQSLINFSTKLKLKREIRDKQIERVKKYNFRKITEKVIAKYDSDKYLDRYRTKSIMPPEDLKWLLSDFVDKYGRECTKKEWEEYGNSFSCSLSYYKGYYFNVMYGQGSIVKIIKRNLISLSFETSSL